MVLKIDEVPETEPAGPPLAEFEIQVTLDEWRAMALVSTGDPHGFEKKLPVNFERLVEAMQEIVGDAGEIRGHVYGMVIVDEVTERVRPVGADEARRRGPS